MKRQRLREATILALLIAGSALTSACAPRETGAAETPPADGVFRGTAVETMDSGGYTYVLLERGDEQVWAAGPETPVAVGDELSVTLAMPMTGFESRTLGRTFETLYFVSSFDGAAPAGSAEAADPHAGIPGMGAPADPHAGIPGMGTPADPHAGVAGMKPGAEAASVDPESIGAPEGGVRIAELWARRAELAGKEVVVRGKVVKYNGGILGRNWIHLQDGTGDPGQGDHDLTVTSDAAASVGDVVTVRGTVAVDQDFGAGYSYGLLVEKAVLETP